MEDARKAAAALKNMPLKAVYCSPLLRTRQTAKAILKFHPAIKLQTSQLINEVNTAHQGKNEESLRSFRGDVYANAQGRYEQPAGILKRTLQFIKRIQKRYDGCHVAAVSHGDVILFLQLWVKGCAITPESKLMLNRSGIVDEYPATGSITTLKYNADASGEFPVLSYQNTSTLKME